MNSIVGDWDAHLESAGGELRFGLAIGEAGEASLVNGDEVIQLGSLRAEGSRGRLWLRPYDSELQFQASGEGLAGEWVGRRDYEGFSRLAFRAKARSEEHLGDPDLRFAGRWAVRFESDAHPAVGVFRVDDLGRARGTFQTALGDFRFLGGSARQGVLELSCFDGAHAFLFRARLTGADQLEGEFWSGDHWQESWTAERDPDAALTDPYTLNTWNPEVSLESLVYSEVDGGGLGSLATALGGHPGLLYLYGSWCPNCTESARRVEALQARFASQGLRTLGLAFEHLSDRHDATEAVLAGREVSGATFPVFLVGSSEKSAASAAFPALDRVLSYPTFVGLDREGVARFICTGFQGAATGAEGEAFLERLGESLEALL